MRRLIFFKRLFSFIFIFFSLSYVNLCFFHFFIFLMFFLFSKFFSVSYVYLCFKWKKTYENEKKRLKNIRRRIFIVYKRQLTSKDTKRRHLTSADVVWQIDCQANIYLLTLKDINIQISSTGLRNLIENFKNTGSVGDKKRT